MVDFLALIRIDQTLTSPSLVDIPPVFVFVQSLRQALLILVLWYRKWPPSVSWVPQQFLMPAAPCYITRNKDRIILILNKRLYSMRTEKEVSAVG